MTSFFSRLGERIHFFWFRKISSAGFGLMRIAFGCTAFLSFLLQAENIQRYYGPEGILPRSFAQTLLRHEWRFSLLDYTSAQVTEVLYFLLLLSLLLVIVGIWTRFFLALSVVLLFSFHEYGTILLDGGDTMLRLIGFLLVLSPCDRSFTLTNFWKRQHLQRNNKPDQPITERQMSIWPYRLLLWQVVCVYLASAIDKAHGPLWYAGSAVAIVLHHSHFARLPIAFADFLSKASPVAGYFVLFTQLAWGLLIVLPVLSWVGLPLRKSVLQYLKRVLLFLGILIHTGIFITMDVGIFSFAMFTAYLGLLIDEDFSAIRSVLNRRTRGPIVVLYDGRCGLCTNSVFLLHISDWLNRLLFANFHDPTIRTKYLASTPVTELEKEIHVLLPNKALVRGFFALRALSWHIPVLWILVPFLYLPGVPTIGQSFYRWIAMHRTVRN